MNAIALETERVKQNAELFNVAKKYEYLLSSHPQAHEEDFQDTQVKNFENEVKAISKDMTLMELRSELLILADKIPSRDKKEEFKRVVSSSSKDELLSIVSSKKVIGDIFKGEGANFTSSNVFNIETISMILAVALMTYLVYRVNTQVSEFENFYSYRKLMDSYVTGAFPTLNFCGLQYLSSTEQLLMKENAQRKCELEATLPETCRFDKFVLSDNAPIIHEEGVYVECFQSARYIADRQTVEVTK